MPASEGVTPLLAQEEAIVLTCGTGLQPQPPHLTEDSTPEPQLLVALPSSHADGSASCPAHSGGPRWPWWCIKVSTRDPAKEPRGVYAQALVLAWH